jgi:N6-adenosine-specific RNA methylase IME4
VRKISLDVSDQPQAAGLSQALCKPRGFTVEGWPQGKYGVIYADPPWRFDAWSDKGTARAADNHYTTMTTDEMSMLPVRDLAMDDCILFIWVCWPTLPEALGLIKDWGFQYKTCAFLWAKARASQLEMFQDNYAVQIGLGYWTRANSEACLLATCGAPKRLDASVRQAIIEPRREHSRKPACIYDRIERLVGGPYIELFARNARPGWDSWGNEVGKYNDNIC